MKVTAAASGGASWQPLLLLRAAPASPAILPQLILPRPARAQPVKPAQLPEADAPAGAPEGPAPFPSAYRSCVVPLQEGLVVRVEGQADQRGALTNRGSKRGQCWAPPQSGQRHGERGAVPPPHTAGSCPGCGHRGGTTQQN